MCVCIKRIVKLLQYITMKIFYNYIATNSFTGTASLVNGNATCCYYDASNIKPAITATSTATTSTTDIQTLNSNDNPPSLLAPNQDVRKSPLFNAEISGIMPGSVIGK